MKNLYVPVMKLVEKVRVGGRYRKRYDRPKSPAARLLEWPELPAGRREWLESQLAGNDPFALAARVEEKLAEVFALCTTGPEDPAWPGASAGLEGSAPGAPPSTLSPVSPIMSQRTPNQEPAPV